ncbi:MULTISPECIES: hypothetical protein [unclassified Micromonospora]|uniref:hypothetical protein n=1 Tax=unclassified Micromonospora TaxID=2617518 RepID=UPI0033FCD3DC
MTDPAPAPVIPTAAMQAAVQAVNDFLAEYANLPGAAIGGQRNTVDALKQLTGFGRLDLAVRVAEVALLAAIPQLDNDAEAQR